MGLTKKLKRNRMGGKRTRAGELVGGGVGSKGVL